ncbi:CRISPR-associated endonuclease/helicase Cas3 [Prauserella shujinwangii]|uniref:CRISPR-associated endonuclease/helicase Cas3 n=1 Tax=Prauserella shujinwangii TaxID=1453103 RepID=A0A2T0LKV6_9PSEU|nr:CRISPR-associated helicase Cas3' [Prauserella shujinwangii]PRX43587.1 CRISPR-associated endonuclease/helicase Cas3 [Prauserella shujinwangii]
MLEIAAGVPVWGAWGKAGSAEQPHPLICHMIDTAAVAERLYDVLLGPAVRADLESGLAALGDVRSWVAVLCGLHDIGKCSPIFQAIRGKLAIRYLGEEVRELMGVLDRGATDREARTEHGTVTAVHLRRCLGQWDAPRKLGIALAVVLGGHHGYLLSAKAVLDAEVRKGHLGGPRWHDLRCELVRAVAELWGLGDPARAGWRAVSLDVPALAGLGGLASVSDWIASDIRNFAYAELPLTDLVAYRDEARGRAGRAVHGRLRWKPWRPPGDTTHAALFGEEPRPLQRAVGELVADRDEPGVLVIEAPTGEGKTRAGFQAAATLVRGLGLSGLYFALPTRATAEHVHAELAAAARALRLEEPPGLVHGGDQLSPSSVNEDGDGDGDGDERAWFTRRRGLLFPVGVGTIDRALQAVIRSRHVFVRLTGLSGKVLVVDEAHDVDAHMTTLLRRLMWWCGRLGIPVVLMSATLPADDREQLIAHWRAGRRKLLPGQVEPRPAGWVGPGVTWAGAEGEPVRRPVELSPVNADRPPIRVHHLGDGQLPTWLRSRVESGGCALVIRNLVRDAVGTYDRLREETRTWERQPELVLLTGQVPADWRARTETWLRENFGPHSADRPHAIVVGTQVLQHSLDVDFDLLASDLAPINELVQRLGRTHRHPRAARACPVPELALVQPPEGRSGPVFPRGLHTVYHQALLLRTLSVLHERTELRLPAEVPQLVHHVYTEPVPPQGPLRERFEKAEATLVARDSEDEARVRRFYLPALRPGDQIRDLTRYPTIAARTRKDTPWRRR